MSTFENSSASHYLPDGKRIGTQNHSYRIIRKLSAGGFGITYLVENESAFCLVDSSYVVEAGRQLVLKECFNSDTMARCSNGFVRLTDSARGGKLRTQFYEEAKTMQNCMGRLNKQYVGREDVGFVPIYHIGKATDNSGNEMLYFVMPYIGGGSLKEYILSAERSNVRREGAKWVYWLYKLLDVMIFIHSDKDGKYKATYHSDIKPANIMLTSKGEPVLIDFGANNTSGKTSMFTKQYAPMEQWGAKALLDEINKMTPDQLSKGFVTWLSSVKPPNRVEKGTDIYSLAATFYHVITGALPPMAHNRPPIVRDDSYVRLGGNKTLEREITESLMQNRPFMSRNKLSEMSLSRAETLVSGLVQRFLFSIDKALSPELNDRYQTMSEWRQDVFVSSEYSFRMGGVMSAYNDESGATPGKGESGDARRTPESVSGASRALIWAILSCIGILLIFIIICLVNQ